METNPQTKLVIHRGTDRPGRYAWSPFVTKLEIRYRLSDLPYNCGVGGPVVAPNGKIPWVELSVPGKDTETLADTSLITQILVERCMLQDMNARLSAKEKAQDLAIRALLEDKLFFYNIRERWINNYYTMRDYSMAKVPLPRRAILGYLGYRANVRKLHDQGTGRFSEDEIRAFRREIWESVNALLEESRKSVNPDECFWVLGGAKPTEADATVYGFIVSTLVANAGPESKQLVQTKCPAAIEYATRIHRRYFSDYEMWD